MRPKSILLLALALGCGLVASIGISQVMNKDDSGEVVEKVQVFVAKVNIPFGEKITAEMVVVENWPKSTVPPGVLNKIEDIVDQSPRNQILEGFPIVESMIGGDDTRASSMLKEGYQTVAVKLAAADGGNLLKVGDRVDVQVYLRQGAAPGIDEAMLQTILQDVAVFAVNQKFQNSSEEEDTGAGANALITLQVKPEEARRINLAKSVGDILLSLRTVTDDSKVVYDPLSLPDVLNLDNDSDEFVKSDNRSGGLSNFIDQQANDAPTPEPGDNEIAHVMIQWVEGVPTRYTFPDITQPPQELSGTPPVPEAENGPTPDGKPTDTDAPTEETDGDGDGDGDGKDDSEDGLKLPGLDA